MKLLSAFITAMLLAIPAYAGEVSISADECLKKITGINFTVQVSGSSFEDVEKKLAEIDMKIYNFVTQNNLAQLNLQNQDYTANIIDSDNVTDDNKFNGTITNSFRQDGTESSQKLAEFLTKQKIAREISLHSGLYDSGNCTEPEPVMQGEQC